MNSKVNLTERNKDYAIFLPSISTFYNNYIAKQQSNPNFVPPERMPDAFENGMEGMNFLNKDKAYYNYKWGLYSAGHAQLNLDKADDSDAMVQKRERDKTFMLCDSGGFQIIKGVIKCDWPNFKNDDTLRHKILNWLEHTGDYSMILDIPTLAADPTFTARTGISSFDECLDYTDFNVNWFKRNRKYQTKYLNVMQGRNWAEAEHWYENMKHHDLEGFAFGGSAKSDINIVLRTLIKMRDDKQLEQGKRDVLHYLGISRLEWAMAYTQIKRSLRETVNPDIEVMFDCASPFLATANGTLYTQHIHKNDRFMYVMEKAMDDKRLSGSNKPFPWGSPIGERLTLGDVCHYSPGMLNKIGKEGKTSWDSFTYMLLMSHNVYQHIESVQRANALTDIMTATIDTDHRTWQKLNPKQEKQQQFDPYVPRNIIYMTNFIEQLFKSETPMQMLDEAAPMLANFNGAKSLATTTNSFNSMFEVAKPETSSDDMDEEAEQAAQKFLQEMEA
ncbi:hypothetical protein N9Q27_00460 [bacterium]|nr:hypothetical protein [bacterium]